ncbi:acetyltransferase [Aliikangiella sp. IMCC44359]|uniref:acetyltransferase n=1 Tax=Aliikangiella sp. IMCC44359 TaxID=3459125 RepID=UPI00403AB1F6
MKSLLIIGAGGHGRAIAETALLSGQWHKIAFIDDKYPAQTTAGVWPIVGNWSDIEEVSSKFNEVFVAIGNNSIRKEKLGFLSMLNVLIPTIVHPGAFVSMTSQIGCGCAVMAGAVVGASAVLGVGCIVNSNATVDHDAKLDKYSHLGVGTHIAGGVKLEEGVWMKAGASASYGVVIKEWTNIPPGVGLDE